MRRLPELDADWRARTARAAARGQVLRYVVSASPKRVSAGLKAVAREHPMGTASGTNNIVVFRSKRYKDVPADRQRTRRGAGGDGGGHRQRSLLAGKLRSRSHAKRFHRQCRSRCHRQVSRLAEGLSGA